MHIAWYPTRFIDLLLDMKVKSAGAKMATPPDEPNRGDLRLIWVKGHELAGILAHRREPAAEQLQALRVGAAGGAAMFRSFAAEQPLVVSVWDQPVEIAPQAHFSLADLKDWMDILGILAMLEDQETAGLLADIGAETPAKALRYPDYCLPLAECWGQLVANRDWRAAHAQAVAAAEQLEDPGRFFQHRDAPMLQAIAALGAADSAAFDKAAADFFNGHKTLYASKDREPGPLISPIGLGLLALARRADLPCSVSSDFAPLLDG